MRQTGLLLTHLQAGAEVGIIFKSVLADEFIERSLFRRPVDMRPHPIADLPISDRLADDIDAFIHLESCGLEPSVVEPALGKISLVVGMKLSGKVQSNLVNKPWQIHPAAHGFA